MVDLFRLWRSENDGKCSVLIPCCIYTDRRTFRTVEQIWKEPLFLFSQKNAACAHTSRKNLMPLRVCPGGVVHDQKTSICNTNFLLWSAMSKTSLQIGMETRRLKSALPKQFRWLERIPNRKTRTITIAAQFRPNCTTFCVMFSCFHKLYLSILCIEVQHQKLSDTETVLRHWFEAWLQDSIMIVYQFGETKRQIILPVWCISTTQNCLGNRLVPLSSENITAIHNEHAWETGKPKNVEICASSGMRKLALKSICATFSPVTPLFLLISEKLMSSAIRKCNLFKILSD